MTLLVVGTGFVIVPDHYLTGLWYLGLLVQACAG